MEVFMPAPAIDRALVQVLTAPAGISLENWNERKAWLASALRERMHAASASGEPWLQAVPDDTVIRAYVLATGNGSAPLSDEALRRFILDVRDAAEFSAVLSWMMGHVDRAARNDMCLQGTWRSATMGASI
jgi:hypothetical protein